MPEYAVAITVTTQIRARNEDQAQERAERILENGEVVRPNELPWMDTYEAEVVDIEEV